jgi:hypothetical protein
LIVVLMGRAVIRPESNGTSGITFVHIVISGSLMMRGGLSGSMSGYNPGWAVISPGN